MSAKQADTAATRLSRLLALVPWLTAHDGVTIDEAAAHFGVPADQLQADLWLLIVTGRPGHMPGDLVDIQFWDEDRRIRVLDAQGTTLVGDNRPGEPPINLADRDWFGRWWTYRSDDDRPALLTLCSEIFSG